MASLEDLLIEQLATFDQLRRILPNYRKLGKDRFTISKTRARIATLKDLWSKCCNLDVRLRQTADDADLKKNAYFVNSDFIRVESEYEECVDKLTDLLDEQEQAERDHLPLRTHESSLIGETHHGTSTFALPRIVIPTFNGEATKWESFRDSFKALVGENVSLTASQKLYYLKSFLEGNAALMLEHITVSDANYEGAWQLLEDEFDNQRALILAHIHAFASLPVMKLENAADIKLLRDTVNSSLAALKNLKRPVEHWDDLLVYLISRKFSPRTRTEWNLSLGASNEFPSFDTLRNFLTERIRGIAAPVQLERNNSNANKAKTKANVNTAAANQCPDCSKPHTLSFCPEWTKKNLDDKFTLAKSKHLCFNCLKTGHFPNSCPSSQRCKQCKRAHHTTLHRASPSNSSATVASGAPTDNSQDNAASVNTLTSSATHIQASVLLATAWVRLRTSVGRVIKARALIDQGSSHSFITESLAQNLRTPRHLADLDITVFGNGKTSHATSYVQ